MRNYGALVCLFVFAGCDSNGNDAMVGQLTSDRVELTAEFAETVTARHVVEGSRVTRGQLLLEQDAARMDARADAARALLAQQQARLDELVRGPRQEQIAAARAAAAGARRDVAFQQLEYDRARNLLAKKLAAPDAVDRAKAALDNAAAQLGVQEARLAELLTGTTVEELRQAEAQLDALRAQLRQVELDRDRLRISAPADGTLDSWLIEPGERPQPGQPLAVLMTGQQPYARVYIPEALRLAVTPGTPAEVYVDGRDTPLRGRVRWVSAEAAFTPFFALTEHDRGRLSFAAKVDLEYDGERLPDGVPTEVRINGATRD